MAYQILGSDKILRMNNSNLLGLVQSEDWSPNFNAQDIFELGNINKVATSTELETTGSLEISAIGGTAGLLARMIPVRSGAVFSGYYYTPTSAALGKNCYTWTEQSLREAQFDLLIHEKSDQVSFDRSVVLPRCFLNTLSGRADANGRASETINFSGDFVIGAPSPYHDVQSYPVMVHSATKLRMLTTDSVTNTTHEIMYVYLDERRWRNSGSGDTEYAAIDASGNFITVTGFDPLALYPNAVGRVIVYKKTGSSSFPAIASEISGTADASAAGTLVDATASFGTLTGYQVVITEGTCVGQSRIITSNSGTTLQVSPNWTTSTPDTTSKYTIYNRDTSIFFVPGYQVNVYIAPATVTTTTTTDGLTGHTCTPAGSEQWLKVQSCDWNVDLKVEALRQLAYNAQGTSVFARVPTYPINITTNATVLESDWKDWKAILTKSFSGSPTPTAANTYTDTYDFAPESINPSFAIIVEYRTRSNVLLQTWRFTDMRLNSRGERTNVGGRAEITWSFAGTAFTLEGENGA
jgi:hypothetical protein